MYLFIVIAAARLAVESNAMARIMAERLFGRSFERLSIEELTSLAGKIVALEIYTPETTPVRTIQATGDTAEDCMAQLAARGLDPRNFEFTMLKAPY
jgi:hypothetical protein